MPKKLLFFILLIFPLLGSAFEKVPALSQGRIRPAIAIKETESAMLPLKYPKGEWGPLALLKESNTNFTLYNSHDFEEIRKQYLSSNVDALAIALIRAYQSIASTPIDGSLSTQLIYPSYKRVLAEWLYYKYPWAELTVVFFALAVLSSLFCITLQSGALTKSAFCLAVLGFFCLTFILALRSFILWRPPVSNMYETVLYVPWISVLLGMICTFFAENSLKRWIVFAFSMIAFSLLLLNRITYPQGSLENVQAVLNSHYWLTIHVLLVVASYGAFIFCGLLGHLYLFFPSIRKSLGKLILQSMYVGVTLIIPGTILGGVWAAESWGRFWDWDPKESWAFISSCIYLIFIHAHRFHKIAEFGLAIGSLVGLLSISFTWYGVNYVLGTGLHTYGFGSGGVSYYFLFVAVELGLIVFYAQAMKSENREVTKPGGI